MVKLLVKSELVTVKLWLAEAVPIQVVKAEIVPVVTIFATAKEMLEAADSQPVVLFLTLNENP